MAVFCFLLMISFILLFPCGKLLAQESFIPIWHSARRILNPRAVTLSPDGYCVGVINSKGLLTVFGRDQQILWQTDVKDADSLVLSSKGSRAIAYSRMHSRATTLYFLTQKGQIVYKHHVSSPVWSAVMSSDGSCSLVGTSSGNLYAYKWGKTVVVDHHWKIRGYPCTIDCATDGRYFAAGIWRKTGVTTYRPDGQYLWRFLDSAADAFPYVQISPTGKYVFSVMQPNPGDYTGHVIIWTASGIKKLYLGLNAYKIHAVIAESERNIAVTYALKVSYPKKQVTEQRVALYTLTGYKIWEKGGIFFSPTLVSISPKGNEVICHDGDKGLYLLDKKGQIAANQDLKFKIQSTQSTRDGKYLLVRGHGGWIQLIQAVYE